MITNDYILQEDLDNIAKELKIIKTLRNSTIFITGATGLVGLSLVRALLNYNDLDGASNKIIGMARNRQKTKDLYKELCNRKDLKIVYGDILDEICITEDVDYIIHCASVTASKMMVEEPVETIMTALQGTKNILDFSVKKKCKSFVYVSSMEVYGSFFSENNNVEEENIGYLDPLKIRSNYPESKRMRKYVYCIYGRIWCSCKNCTFSSDIWSWGFYWENRVFAQFARSVIRMRTLYYIQKVFQKETIATQATPAWRSFCFLRKEQMVRHIIFRILLRIQRLLIWRLWCVIKLLRIKLKLFLMFQNQILMDMLIQNEVEHR